MDRGLPGRIPHHLLEKQTLEAPDPAASRHGLQLKEEAAQGPRGVWLTGPELPRHGASKGPDNSTVRAVVLSIMRGVDPSERSAPLGGKYSRSRAPGGGLSGSLVEAVGRQQYDFATDNPVASSGHEALAPLPHGRPGWGANRWMQPPALISMRHKCACRLQLWPTGFTRQR